MSKLERGAELPLFILRILYCPLSSGLDPNRILEAARMTDS